MSDFYSSIDNCHDEGNSAKRTIFLLTKPPGNDRTKLCFLLMKLSKNPILYLAGDGVYNLLNGPIDYLPHDSIYVCKEDMDARGVQSTDAIILIDNFYEQLVEEMMLWSDRIYAF
jgi:tRNA 2-thiouridine synthesizing protein B